MVHWHPIHGVAAASDPSSRLKRSESSIDHDHIITSFCLHLPFPQRDTPDDESERTQHESALGGANVRSKWRSGEGLR
eukprot:5972625-Pyramimonas_sp.AAC.3